MPTNEQIIAILKTVKDPEVHLDIWTMGLIYEIDPGSPVKITMTYTTPFCPWGPDLEKEIKEKLSAAGMSDPVVTITFDPPYRMPDELRASLGI